MAELLALVSILTSTVLITLFLVDIKQRRGESQARIDFKADFQKAGATLLKNHNEHALQLQNLSERLSALEMRGLTGKK